MHASQDVVYCPCEVAILQEWWDHKDEANDPIIASLHDMFYAEIDPHRDNWEISYFAHPI